MCPAHNVYRWRATGNLLHTLRSPQCSFSCSPYMHSIFQVWQRVGDNRTRPAVPPLCRVPWHYGRSVLVVHTLNTAHHGASCAKRKLYREKITIVSRMFQPGYNVSLYSIINCRMPIPRRALPVRLQFERNISGQSEIKTSTEPNGYGVNALFNDYRL